MVRSLRNVVVTFIPAHHIASETERKFTMASTVGPHAECLVLDEICHEVAASYIGTSGTSCRLCELYFGARINIDWCIVHCGPPMEGQENCMPTEWRVPDMAEGRLRDYFRKKMLSKLREKAELMEGKCFSSMSST